MSKTHKHVNDCLGLMLYRQKHINKLPKIKEYVFKVELAEIEHKKVVKRLNYLINFIKIEDLPSDVEVLQMIKLLCCDCSKVAKSYLSFGFQINRKIKNSDFVYIIECVENVYSYYNNAGLKLDSFYIMSMHEFADTLSLSLKQHKSYKATCSTGLFMSLKTEIDNFAETYAEFLQLIEKDCRVIEHTLNKQKTAK